MSEQKSVYTVLLFNRFRNGFTDSKDNAFFVVDFVFIDIDKFYFKI